MIGIDEFYEKLVEYKLEYENLIIHVIQNDNYIFRYLASNEYLSLSRVILMLEAQKIDIDNFYRYIFALTMLYTNANTETKEALETKKALGKIVFEKSKFAIVDTIKNEKPIREHLTDIDIVYTYIVTVFPSYKLEDLYHMDKMNLYKLFILSLDMKQQSVPKFIRKVTRQHIPINTQFNNKNKKKEPNELEQTGIVAAEQALWEAKQNKSKTVINIEKENEAIDKLLGPD